LFPSLVLPFFAVWKADEKVKSLVSQFEKEEQKALTVSKAISNGNGKKKGVVQ